MTETRPPRKDVVSRAVSTLVEGICEENECDLRYSGIAWADAVPVGSLVTFRDELEAVKARVIQQLDNLIARLALRLNRVTSSVHSLPVELLVMIFEEFEPSAPLPGADTSLFDLLLVCRNWYDTIIGSPQLWGYLSADMPYRIARMVVDRSQLHPISVKWHNFGLRRGPKRDKLAKLLDLAIENSTRIRRVDIITPRWSPENPRKLLEAPTPALKTLRVQVHLDGTHTGPNDSFDEFTLSEGPHLEHLYLRAFPTPLDSPRLSNLRTLTLSQHSVPKSPDQLLRLLSISQRLEVLDIQDTSHSMPEEVRASAPVLLQHLKKLVLSKMPDVYNAIILASIHTPSCSYVEVRDRREDEETAVAVEALDAVIWQLSNDQATSLVGIPGAEPGRSTFGVQISPTWISVERVWELQGCCKLQFARTDIYPLAARLGAIISHLPSPPALHPWKLNIKTWGHSLIDLLPWSEVVESLQVEGKHSCRSVLRQLSQRHMPLETGGVDWVCTKLTRIKLVYMRDEEEDKAHDGEALLSLVRQRWSSKDGPPGAAQPVVFEVSCSKTKFPNLWSLKDEITRILPSFRLDG